MIPVNDSVRTRRFPWVNLILIAVSVLVFLYELRLGPDLDAFVLHWGATPSLVLRALARDPRVPPSVLWTLVTSQFVHAGWAHLLGNMLFLWVFGRAVEDRVGHFFYLILYLAWGVAAALVQILLVGPAREPLIGASGAISGVLGAYLVFYPTAWISLLVPIFFFFWIVDVPALLVLGFWFLVQFLEGAAAITRASHATAGIAFGAHLGGFLCGVATALFIPRPTVRAPQPGPRPMRREQPGGLLGTVAGTLSVVANVLALAVAVRLLVLATGFGLRGALAPLTRMLYVFTLPLVEPFMGVLPAIRVDGRTLELFSLAAALAYWGAGALIAWMISLGLGRR